MHPAWTLKCILRVYVIWEVSSSNWKIWDGIIISFCYCRQIKGKSQRRQIRFAWVGNGGLVLGERCIKWVFALLLFCCCCRCCSWWRSSWSCFCRLYLTEENWKCDVVHKSRWSRFFSIEFNIPFRASRDEEAHTMAYHHHYHRRIQAKKVLFIMLFPLRLLSLFCMIFIQVDLTVDWRWWWLFSFNTTGKSYLNWHHNGFSQAVVNMHAKNSRKAQAQLSSLWLFSCSFPFVVAPETGTLLLFSVFYSIVGVVDWMDIR